MKCHISAIIVLVVGLGAYGNSQDTTTIKGDCNPVIRGDGNTVTVVCSDRRQAVELKQLLQKLLSSQVSTEVLMQHLDDIEKGVAKCEERSLTSEQAGRFKQALGSAQETIFMMVCDTRVPDSCSYAQDFVNAMTLAGWKAGPEISTPVGGDIPVGVQVAVNNMDADEGKTQAAVQFLQAAHVIGLEMQHVKDMNVPRGQVEVRFGKRQ